MHLIITVLIFVVTSTLLTGTAAFAADHNHNDAALTLEQAIINVLEHNPALKAAGYESLAASERFHTATLPPALRGSIELENFAGSGSYDGSDAMESTLSLSRVLETGDKARLRGELSRNETLLLQNEQDSARLDLLAETAKRFIDVVTGQQRLSNADDTINIADRTKQAVEKRVKAGKSPAAELRRAEIALSRSRLQFDQIKRQLDSARLKLATLWGETQVNFGDARADLFSIEAPAPFASLVALIENNPDLVRYATEQRLTRSRSLLAKSAARADIRISGGLRHFNDTDDTAFVLSLDIPFAASSRASAKIRESDFMAMRDPYLYEKQRLELYTTLFELYQQAEQSIDTLNRLRDTIIPQAEEALQDYEKAYIAGRYSFLELTEAQQLLIDLKMEAVIAASDYHRYLVEIDRLTGVGQTSGASL